jgi:predicted dehydrogenase
MNLRVGLLGCGGIGGRHATAVGQVAGLELVACCGRDKGKTEEFSARFGAAPYADFERMLGEEELDLLIVALPPFAHTGQAEMAAQAGVSLLVEKPISLDIGRANTMVAASAGVVAACGFMCRFGAAVERWDAADPGQALHFSGSFHCNALHVPWWREREKSGGQMVEQLIHITDLARHALGMPQTVYARAANLRHRDVPGYDSEDISAILLGYGDGRIGVLHASNVAIPGRWMKQWQIVATTMTGIFADMNKAELVRTVGEPTSEYIDVQKDVFVAQLDDVADAIRNRRPPRVPLKDGAHSLRIALAARRSADEGREIAL